VTSEETWVRDSQDNEGAAYDVSETAFKKLYQESEDDRFEESMTRVAEAETRADFSPKNTVDLAPNPISQTAKDERRRPGFEDRSSGLPRGGGLVVSPPAALEAPPSDRLDASRDDAPLRKRRAGPVRLLGLLVVATIAVTLLFVYVPFNGPARTRPEARVKAQSPVITGVLHPADLAAGHTIKPGEIYGVEAPPSEVNIAVTSGQVALTMKDGAAMRACSNESFALTGAAARSESPLIAACGGAPAFIQAVIPQPALPADPISPPVMAKPGGG
jgi:hypothetical protein